MKIGGVPQGGRRFERRLVEARGEFVLQDVFEVPPIRIAGSNRNSRPQDQHAAAIALDLVDEVSKLASFLFVPDAIHWKNSQTAKRATRRLAAEKVTTFPRPYSQFYIRSPFR